MSRSSQAELSDLSLLLDELYKQKSSPDDEVARNSKEAVDMWHIYEKEAEKYNGAVTEAQKTDADSVLVFTGLLAATVAVFIVESYKKLSPDPGDSTTILLTQISQQLAGFRNNSYPAFKEIPPFSPSFSILMVNALWFLSLLIAIVSAFYLMLVQQWIRRYTQTLAELPSDQERVRSCLFIGTQKYKMSHAIGLIPLPLHISVFLFFIGLIIFLFTISDAIAVVLLVACVLITLLYMALTILPITDDLCPYFTPMSEVGWYSYHSFLTAMASACRWVVEWVRDYSGSDEEAGEGRFSELSKSLKDFIRKNREYLKGGLTGKTFRHAKKTPIDVDLITLTWLLQRPMLADKGKLQAFVDSIPPRILIHLSSLDADYGKKSIREHLSNLLQDSLNVAGPERNHRLQICLHALYQIVKSSTLPDQDTEMIHEYVWSNFKVLKSVQQLWDDEDPTIRFFSRSICAHISRNIVRNHKSDESEKAWLRAFVGKKEEPGDFAPQASDHLAKWDHFILESFVFGVFPCLKDGLFTWPEHATYFVETLAVLMNAGNSGAFSQEIFSEEILSFTEWAKESDRDNHEEVVAKLKQLFGKIFAEADHPTTDKTDQDK